jgi:transposase-like protein
VTLDASARRALERAGTRQREATEARNQAIAEAQQTGASLREIAEAVGLSHTAVARILKQRGG